MPPALTTAATIAAVAVAVAVIAAGVAVTRRGARSHHMPGRTADVVVIFTVRVVVRAVGVVVVAGGAVGHRLEGHGVVELERVGRGHRSTAADGVHQTVKRGAPRRWEGRSSRWPSGSAVRGRKDATTSLSTYQRHQLVWAL